jgi:hypothetical protein
MMMMVVMSVCFGLVKQGGEFEAAIAAPTQIFPLDSRGPQGGHGGPF